MLWELDSNQLGHIEMSKRLTVEITVTFLLSKPGFSYRAFTHPPSHKVAGLSRLSPYRFSVHPALAGFANTLLRVGKLLPLPLHDDQSLLVAYGISLISK